MSDSGLDQGPFVVSAGPWRIFLLGPLLVLAGMVFLSLALVMVYVDVANPLGRLALWGAALGLAAMALYFLLLAAALTMRVEVAPDALRLRIPRWQSVLPWFPWIRAGIPYADIAAVETRDEVYSSFGLTSVQTAYSIATKAGRRIVLGFTSPLATWNYPFDEAAARIARNATVTVAGLPDTPDAFGNASAVTFATATGSPLEIKFATDGTFVNQDGLSLNGTVFVALPNQRLSARAVTVFGSTGRVRAYRWDGRIWKRV